MNTCDLLLRRLHAQHLLAPAPDPAADLCGLQAQFLRNAVHALRIRTDCLTLDGLVKTWTLRGTVHLVPERDLPLYIRHCGTAEDVCESDWYQWTLGRGHANPPEKERHFARLTVDAIANGIDEREALRLHLREQGMTEDEEARVFNPWGGLIAELANIGAIAFRVDMADNHRADEAKRYRLLTPFAPMDESAAKLELARRYFTHYGPATLRDAAYFLHWTQAEVKALLAQLPVESMVCEGRTHFFLPCGEPTRDLPDCILLAGFDPLMLGYRKEDNPFLPSEHLRGIFNLAGIVNPAILLHGRVVGKWRSSSARRAAANACIDGAKPSPDFMAGNGRTWEKASKVELTAFEALSPTDKKLVELEADRLFSPRKIVWT